MVAGVDEAAAAAALARAWLEAEPVNDHDAISCTRKAVWQLLVAIECLIDDAREREDAR